MPNIALNWDPSDFRASLSLAGADLETGNDLASAVIISLFTWRRANPDDELPNETSGLKGWWGDSYPPVPGDRIGSRLWLFKRKKITQATLAEIREVCLEALQWMIDDGVASAVDIQIERDRLDGLAGTITISSPNGAGEILQFAEIWKVLNG
ncbi:MAG: phage GP46 family protein [Sneathiella sp.]